MSAAAARDTFAAVGHVEAGDWDLYLAPLLLAIKARMSTPEYREAVR